MPRLFSADTVSVLYHVFVNIFITNLCFFVINTKFIKGFIKSEVRHDCCYYSVVAKCTFFFEIASINV